ncbi:MAG TPA: LapA family protein [Acidimicrobiales bacterium]|nr:LapA family protein [Acidimicrobiales bacterium]
MAAAVLLVLLVIFVFQNTEETEIRFIVPEIETPLWVALAITMVIGLVVGFLLARGRNR